MSGNSGFTDQVPRWASEDDHWARVCEPRLDASVRIFPASRLWIPDRCFYEARTALSELYGASDLDALGGRRAVIALAAMLRGFGSADANVPVILKAIRRPVTAMRSTDAKEILVLPKIRPRLIVGAEPKLPLFHSGERLRLPETLQLYRPDRSYSTVSTIEVLERGMALSNTEAEPQLRRDREVSAYTGQQRSLCLNPDTYRSMCTGESIPVFSEGYSINLIRLKRTPYTNSWTSVRFGINFSRTGQWINDVWTKWSDFGQFLRVYPVGFRDALAPLFDGDCPA